MYHGIVLLICLIVPEIHLCYADDSQRGHQRPNLGNYLILRNVVQEDYIDLNSIKPDILMKLGSNILNKEKNVPYESVQNYLHLPRNHSQVVLMPPGERSIHPKNYLPSNQNPHNENMDDSVHRIKFLEKDKELEAINTKYMKMYSEKNKNVNLITKEVEPKQGNELRADKEKGHNEPQKFQSEEQIIYQENKEDIVLNKKLLNLPISSENGNPNFNSKLKESPDNNRVKIEETKGFQKKLDHTNHPSTIENSRGQMHKPDKVSSMNKDQKEYHTGPLAFGKNSGPMNERNANSSVQINPKSYLDIDHNLIQPGNFLIAKVTSKKGDAAPNDQILLKSRNSFMPTKKPFEYTLTTSAKTKTNSILHKAQNFTKTPSAFDNALPNHEEKVGEGYLSTDFNNGLKQTGKEGDINDLIQVDVYGAFFHKPINDTLRQKKNIEGKEREKLITPWKTVDMVLAGFVLLTMFVLGTICLALRMKKKRKRKKPRELFMESEEIGCFDGMFSSPSKAGALKRRSPAKVNYATPERVHLSRFSVANKWQSMSESYETSGKTSDYSEEVSWSETESSIPDRHHRRSTLQMKPPPPEPAKQAVSRSVSSMTLPSLPTILTSLSSGATVGDVVKSPSYSFQDIAGYIPSNMVPSLPTVSSGSSNMSDS